MNVSSLRGESAIARPMSSIEVLPPSSARKTEGEEAIKAQPRIADRATFLLHAIATEVGIRAEQLVVLLALQHVPCRDLMPVAGSRGRPCRNSLVRCRRDRVGRPGLVRCRRDRVGRPGLVRCRRDRIQPYVSHFLPRRSEQPESSAKKNRRYYGCNDAL